MRLLSRIEQWVERRKAAQDQVVKSDLEKPRWDAGRFTASPTEDGHLRIEHRSDLTGTNFIVIPNSQVYELGRFIVHHYGVEEGA